MLTTERVAPPFSPSAREIAPRPDAVSEILKGYGEATWNSIGQTIHPDTGLPYDRLTITAEGYPFPTGNTSPANIGFYLLSTLAAHEMAIISPGEAQHRIGHTLDTLATMQEGSGRRFGGLFLNWYEPATGAPAQEWPNGEPVKPFLSSVDNGILATSLAALQEAPHVASRADTLRILGNMDFARFEDPLKRLMVGGIDGATGQQSPWYYDLVNTDGRIAAIAGTALFNLSPDVYMNMGVANPTVRDTHDLTKSGYFVTHEGEYVVRSWNATGFEALMGQLFLPEDQWGTKSWALNHPRYVREQIRYGQEHHNGMWGFSSCFTQSGRYVEQGVPHLGMNPHRETPTTVSPHAVALALPFERDNAVETLEAMKTSHPGVYDPELGFGDGASTVGHDYTTVRPILDQSMLLLAIFNETDRAGRLPHEPAGVHRFTAPQMERSIRSVMEEKEFYPNAA
jgi:hypothetical protein